MSNAPIETKLVHMVSINEYSSWSGMETLGEKYFPDKESAIKFGLDYNIKHNNKHVVPEEYIKMEYAGQQRVTKEAFEKNKAVPEWEWSSDL